MNATATFSDMIDFSFPEIGNVNFNMLQYFLHALVKHLQLHEAEMEFDQLAKDKLGGKHSRKYMKTNMDDEERGERTESDENGIKSVDLKFKSSVPKPQKTNKVFADSPSKEEEWHIQSAKNVEILEKKVSDIEEKLKMVETQSNSMELISRSRQATNTPFSDMWNIVNLTKRMDASEDGLRKFATALEELSRETGKINERISNIMNKLNMHDIQIDESEKTTTQSTAAEGTKEFEIQSVGSKISFGFDIADNKLAEVLEKINQKLAKMKKQIIDLTAQQRNILSFTESFPLESFPDVLTDLGNVKSWVDNIATQMPSSNLNEKMEAQLEEHAEKLNDLNMNLINLSDTFQGQITDIERELGTMLEKCNTGVSAGEEKNNYFKQDMASLGELYNKLQGLQGEIESLNETTTTLISEQKERETNINTLLEQVQLIKNIKADKEALEDALAEKADAFSVNRKVSYDQFDAAYYELNQSIIDAQARLGCQEQAWVTAIAEIQKDIGEKLDKMEITPLQEVINNKIKHIEDNVKAISEKRKEPEAWGTKKKLLRNVNCISCDKKVVMRTELEGPLLPKPDGLPPTRSMRPFLTYELDHIRKACKRSPHRNFCHFENAAVEPKPKTDEEDGITLSGSHFCSRYCGGSHTLITNEQRVRRVGHFSDQGVASENLKGIHSTPEQPQEKS